MLRWPSTVSFRKYIILWGYFGILGANGKKPVQNSHNFIILKFKIGFSQKALVMPFRFQLFYVYFWLYFHNLLNNFQCKAVGVNIPFVPRWLIGLIL